MAKVDWDQAGFTDARGRAGKPIPSGRVLIPGSIRLENDFLVWDISPSAAEPPKTQKPSPSMLNRFLRLHKASDDTILAYARQYGILMLDADGSPTVDWEGPGRESLYDWRRISRMACAILNLAAALNSRQLGNAEEWKIIDALVNPLFPKNANPSIAPFLPHGLPAARQTFRRIFKGWLRFAGITFGLDFEPNRDAWRTEVDYGGRFFSALVLQLLLTIVNADSLYFCSGCGLPYARDREKRRPKSGQRNFCDECIAFGVPLQFADRDRKQKQAHARALFQAGKTVTDISRELNSKPGSVKRWVKGLKQNGKTKTR